MLISLKPHQPNLNYFFYFHFSQLFVEYGSYKIFLEFQKKPSRTSQKFIRLHASSNQVPKKNYFKSNSVEFITSCLINCFIINFNMLQSIPHQFQIAQFIEPSILQQMQMQSQVYKTPVTLLKKHQQIFAMAMTSQYISFGIIEQNQIAFVCYIPLIKDLRFEKLFKNEQQKIQIIGFKLIYQNQQLEIYFKNKQCVQLLMEKLSRKLTQHGFHQQFRPMKKIGKGGFATVYEVKRNLDGKMFAVKAFSKASAFLNPASKATLQNQISILKMMNQQNLLHLYEVFESSNSLYLVMELYEGGDLVSLIRKNNAYFNSTEIKGFMQDLLKGLKSLEQLKIMHRDIKPQNIMIRKRDDQRELVIGDFGLASQTQISKYLLERCGTPGYVAPEISHFQPSDRLTTKCDIFSLGVIFHILLCRTHLFNGSSCDEVYKKNKNMEFDLNDQKYNCIDVKALQLMKKMLARDPAQRISASEALQHKYFYDDNNCKILDTPITTCPSRKQPFRRLNQNLEQIRQVLYF